MSRETVIIDGCPLSFEVGYWATQARSSVVFTSGDAFVLTALTAEDEPREGVDFLPLTVEYRERLSAAGRIPGNYDRREGKPSLFEILCSRLIDRSIRPLFPGIYRSETQVMATVLSADPGLDLPVITITSASLALMLSDIPWEGPVAALRIGRVDGRFVVFPDQDLRRSSDMDFVITVGTGGVLMVEGQSRQILETDMADCLQFAEQVARPLLDFQQSWARRAKVAKRALLSPRDPPEGVLARIESHRSHIKTALTRPSKKERQEARHELSNRLLQDCIQTLDHPSLGVDEPSGPTAVAASPSTLEAACKTAIEHAFHQFGRELILEGTRFDGRANDEVRPIDCRVRVLPAAHGSAVFTRGETQALASCTLAGPRDSLRQETMAGQDESRFFLHYNFPAFSVGEARPPRTPGRREIGHGNLANRALQAVVPSPETFPYTIRLVSDILSSNGSSSMATVCAGCLALLDAGVPLTSLVAGVAMGLIKEGDRVAILTDILGDEDHLGDMDFKVCGTRRGITALQMDLKVGGLTRDLMARALEQARQARLHVLDIMERILPAARPAVSARAEKVMLLAIRPERIGDVIGTGGRNIRAISESTGAHLDVDDTGSVRIAASEESALAAARRKVLDAVRDPRVSELYTGTVLRLMQSQAIVEILPGTEGILHISDADDGFVSRLEDLFAPGDSLLVKVTGVDDRGRIRLSRKGLKAQA